MGKQLFDRRVDNEQVFVVGWDPSSANDRSTNDCSSRSPAPSGGNRLVRRHRSTGRLRPPARARLSHPLRRLVPMAAVIVTTTASPPARARPPAPARPPLQVIPGGRQAARAYARRPSASSGPLHPAVYRRRRLGAALVLVSLAGRGGLPGRHRARRRAGPQRRLGSVRPSPRLGRRPPPAAGPGLRGPARRHAVVHRPLACTLAATSAASSTQLERRAGWRRSSAGPAVSLDGLVG